MSTYIQSVTDYIPQIQPFKPDYNFLANVLQTRQSRYDSNYDKLSGVYTSLFNAPMLRESDIQKKDEFFKNIDQNIKKISGMDLSLQQNVDAASKVFQPFYDDKNLVNDMVTTKKYINGVGKHDSLKGCTDPEKCGGRSWEPGLAELNYKASEYKNTTDEEALKFNMPDYTPYYDWKKEAIKLGMEKGFDVTYEQSNGQYIVKDTNGNLVKGGLYNLYQNMYGNDPRVAANYQTQAYVQRKRAVEEGVSKGMTEQAAESSYLSDKINNGSSRVNRMLSEFTMTADTLNEKINQIKKEAKGPGNLPDDVNSLDALIQKQVEIKNTLNKLEILDNGIHNNADSHDLNVLRFRADNASILELQTRDMTELASAMSMKGMKHEISADPYGTIAASSNYALRNQKIMAGINYQYALGEKKADLAAKIDFERLKESGFGTINTESTGTPVPGYQGTETHPDLDPKTPIVNQFEAINRIHTDANLNNQALIVDALSTIRTGIASNSPAAIEILNKNFGADGAKIDSREKLVEYLNKNKKTSGEVLTSLLTALDEKANPMTNVSWANSFMQHNGERIQKAKMLNMAYDLTNKTERKHWSDIYKKIQTNNSDPANNKAYLMLSPLGDIVSADEFKRKYNEKYNDGKAEQTYKTIQDKFFTTYNNTVPGINQAPGLPIGGNTTKVDAIEYRNVSRDRPGADLNRVNSIISSISDASQSGQVNVFTGKVTEDNVNTPNNPAVQNILRSILTDNLDRKGKGTSPNIDFIELGLAGADKNKSGFVLKVNNPEYFDKFQGTKRYPGLSNDLMQDILVNGISVVYPNKEVRTLTTDALTAYDPLEQIVKNVPYTINSFPKGGEIKFTYNPSTYMVDATGSIYKHNIDGTSYSAQTEFTSFPIGDVRAKEAYYKNLLGAVQNQIINEAEPVIRRNEKNKQIAQTSNQ